MNPAPTPLAAQVIALEQQWTKLIRSGCANGASAAARKALVDFMDLYLAPSYTNTDTDGSSIGKLQDIANCGNGLYLVTNITEPNLQAIQSTAGKYVMVVGLDSVAATFSGMNVGGDFIWTDAWEVVDGQLLCNAHRGWKE